MLGKPYGECPGFPLKNADLTQVAVSIENTVGLKPSPTRGSRPGYLSQCYSKGTQESGFSPFFPNPDDVFRDFTINPLRVTAKTINSLW